METGNHKKDHVSRSKMVLTTNKYRKSSIKVSVGRLGETLRCGRKAVPVLANLGAAPECESEEKQVSESR